MMPAVTGIIRAVPGIGKTPGAIATVLITSLIIYILFFNHISEASQVSFASGGDGLKSTFGTLYHIKYDSSYWHFEGMNYPFGESVFFTGNQTFLTNAIKLTAELGWDLSTSALGILNLCLLFSYVLCALLLYLILTELKLPVWYAILGSITITLLSPQWDRLSGHYNLAYAYVIPLALYMMIRFHKRPSWWVSILFSLFILIVAGKHFYFLPLVGIVWIVFWISMLAGSRKPQVLIPHLLLQFIVPVVIFMLFASNHDMVSDRTAYPWGFFRNTAGFSEVFLPIHRPYGRWLSTEGFRTIKYVGFVSTIVFFSLPVVFFRRWMLFGNRGALRLSDKPVLNVLFVGGLLSLILSMGVPFIMGQEQWLNFTGPFRQFRAIGRFFLPFYYILNIFSLYILWKWYLEKRKRSIAVILILALSWNCYDAWINMNKRPSKHYNKFEMLNDWDNLLPGNQWVSNHDWSEYQAIMPLPYYHIGSENYWINGDSPVIEPSFIVSLKTGLPLNSVMLSRTSLSQTLASLDLYWEPYHDYPVLKHYTPNQPVLLLRQRESTLSHNENALIGKSTLIDSSNQLLFYRLFPDSLWQLLEEQNLRRIEVLEDEPGNPDSLARIQSGSFDSLSRYHIGSFDSLSWFCFDSFDSLPGGVLSMDITDSQNFYRCELPAPGDYTISFWYKGAGTDLWPRTQLSIRLADSARTTYSFRLSDFFRETVLRENNRALLEFDIVSRNPGDILELDYSNGLLIDGVLTFDNIMVHNSERSVIVKLNGMESVNNRLPWKHRRLITR